MKKIKISATSVAASTNGYAAGVTGASWTLTTTTPGDTLAHQVTIQNNTSTSHSGKTATLSGTDADGNAVSEVLSLPGANLTVTSVNYYAKLLTVTPSATVGTDTMDIGWSAASRSCWAYTYPGPSAFSIGFGCSVDSGSPTYGVQNTYGGTVAFNHATVAAQTAQAQGSYLYPIQALRLTFTAAGGVTLTALQAGG